MVQFHLVPQIKEKTMRVSSLILAAILFVLSFYLFGWTDWAFWWKITMTYLKVGAFIFCILAGLESLLKGVFGYGVFYRRKVSKRR